MAHVERRGQGRWRARYRGPDGKERSKTFARRMDAEKWLAQVETNVARGEWVDPARAGIRLDEWVRQWLPSRKADLRPTSYARLESVLNGHVLPRFGERRINTLGNREVRTWVADMQAEGLSAASIRKAAFALRAALAAAIADARITVNPATDIPLPAEQIHEQRFLSRAEVDALIESTDERYRVAVRLAALCGLRWGEVAGLRRSRIDVLRSRIEVIETAVEIGGKITSGPPKTKGSRRVVPVARSVMAEIDAHLTEFVGPQPDALLVTATSGGPMHRGTFARQVWRPAVKAAGLDPLRFHDLRHSYVSLLIASGANVKAVAQWAGHSSPVVTLSRYSHVFDDHAEDVADAMDALLSPPTRSASLHQITG